MTPSELARTASPAIKGLSRRSNRKLVRNAIIFLCLAGGHLQEKKMRVLKVCAGTSVIASVQYAELLRPLVAVSWVPNVVLLLQ